MRLLETLHEGLVALEHQGLRRRRRVAGNACAPHQELIDPACGLRRHILNFCSNDYLGLADHAALADALTEGAAQYGTGSGGSHLILGHSHAHAQLEATLANWQAPYIPQADALYFCSGYMANLAVLGALGTAQASIFSEALNHASLIDGARLARANVHRFPHRDLDTLDALLSASTSSIKIIVSDAVFSMDGCVADAANLLELAHRHDAWLVLDDAHGFGVLGAHGRGVLEHAGLCSDRIIYIGTLGKAAGVSGAFVAAHETVVAHLVQHARSYIYTTAAPPALAQALMRSLDIIGSVEGQRLRTQLGTNIKQFREGMQALPLAEQGASLMDSQMPIQPLIVGSNAQVMAISGHLDARNIIVGAIRPPTVPLDTARLRITLCATHTPDDIDALIAALRESLAQPREAQS